MMKYSLFILSFLFCYHTASADSWTDYISPDTIKSPEGKALTAKQQRRLGNQRLGTDFSLSQTKKKADELFNQLGYMAAVSQYEKLDGIELNEFVQSKLANSFRLNGEYEKAEYWYSQCINETPHPEDYLHYAEVLQINGKCEDAVRWNKEYLVRTLDTKRDVITDCNQLEEITKHEAVEVRNLLTLNTSDLDFSAIPYQNGLVFTSNRGMDRLTKKRDRWTKDNFTDLFYAKINEQGEVTEIEGMTETLNHKLHDGTATFNQFGNEMIFSRSDEEGESKDKIKELQLYTSTFKAGAWTDAKKLLICKSDYAYCHPTFSKDNKKIYFTSNQPGGYGGMDIWVSENINGEWKKPVNLGPNVNTSGNELFPFFAKDNTLYFSSNGHRGLGGLDIFYVRQNELEDDRTWTERTNLGQPFNSNKDDFSFTIDREGERGYFTSNRDGGMGNDDIYAWVGTLNNAKILTELSLIDEKSKKRLSNVDVKILKQADDLSTTTDFEGNIILPVEKQAVYDISINLLGYKPMALNAKGSEILDPSFKLILKPLNSVKAQVTIINQEYDVPLADAELMIFDRCTGETKTFKSNAAGQLEFEANCDCEYEIRGQKKNFIANSTILSQPQKDCVDFIKNNEKRQVRLPLSLDKPDMPLGYTTSKERTIDGSLNLYFLGSDELKFEAGQVIRLSMLYYDFDKYDIRNDASKELDKVYELLTTYQTMKIALLSHTDSRGRDRYNTRLSQKRAFAARDYLLSKGISTDRVSAVGIGEGLPVNECTDGVDCDEDKHQQNRRTEIKITAMEEPGVRVDRR